MVVTWRVSLDVAHLDEAIGRLLDIVVGVGENVQEKVLFHSRKHTLQIPVKGQAKSVSQQ
jgi:hypothetical protein